MRSAAMRRVPPHKLRLGAASTASNLPFPTCGWRSRRSLADQGRICHRHQQQFTAEGWQCPRTASSKPPGNRVQSFTKCSQLGDLTINVQAELDGQRASPLISTCASLKAGDQPRLKLFIPSHSFHTKGRFPFCLTPRPSQILQLISTEAFHYSLAYAGCDQYSTRK